jgi:hypothetical protein
MEFEQVLYFFDQQRLLLGLILFFVVAGITVKLLSSPFSLYKNREHLLTRTEVRSYFKIKPIVQAKGLELMAQVRIADVISVSGRQNKRWWNAFKQISSKHVDFVVVKPSSNFQIVCAIEIDDSSHLKKPRIKRDVFINKVFKSAGVPLLRCTPGNEQILAKEIYQCAN